MGLPGSKIKQLAIRTSVLGLATDNGLFAKREGYNTFTLKWCTPAAKSGTGGDQIYATHAACRCTPVEVNSRPSACLTSFLLAGKVFFGFLGFGVSFGLNHCEVP